jgi:hypothetical protein
MENIFEKICGDPLWFNSTQNSTLISDFTFCFENTLLVWYPCFIVWILTPGWIYMVKRVRLISITITWLTIAKIVKLSFYSNFLFRNKKSIKISILNKIKTIISLMIVIELIRLINASQLDNSYPVHFMTPIIMMITYVN